MKLELDWRQEVEFEIMCESRIKKLWPMRDVPTLREAIKTNVKTLRQLKA